MEDRLTFLFVHVNYVSFTADFHKCYGKNLKPQMQTRLKRRKITSVLIDQPDCT